MKFKQEFTVSEPIQTVWDFFQKTTEVATCMPGIDNIQVIDPDQLSVRMTQKVGPISASFDTTVRITERIAPTVIQFTLIGKAVRGAVGNFRATNTVMLHEQGGSTYVTVEGEAALAGALGSVGQRIIGKQAEKLTAAFAANLVSALSGEAPIEAAAASGPVSTLATPRPSHAPTAHLPAGVSTPPPAVFSEPSRLRNDPWNKVSASFSVATFIVSLFILYHLASGG